MRKQLPAIAILELLEGLRESSEQIKAKEQEKAIEVEDYHKLFKSLEIVMKENKENKFKIMEMSHRINKMERKGRDKSPGSRSVKLSPNPMTMKNASSSKFNKRGSGPEGEQSP